VALQRVVAHERIAYSRYLRRLTCRLTGRLANPVERSQGCSTQGRGVSNQIAAVQAILQGITELSKLVMPTIFHDRRWVAKP
jgi:hypothetical protein